MMDSSNTATDVDIDIRGLLAGIAKRKWPLLILTLISAALFFVVFSSVSNRYKSTSSIILEQRESALTRIGGQNLPSAGASFDIGTVGTQVEIMNSDDLAFEVIRELGLVRDSEFGGKEQDSFSIMGLISSLFSLDSSQQDAIAIAEGEPTQAERGVLETYRERLQIFATPNTHLISITFWAHRRDLARDVVNLIAEKYLVRNRSAKSASTDEATKWLGPLIASMETKLSTSENEMEEFKASNDIFTGANNASLATQQLSEFSTELSNIRARRASAEAKVQAIRNSLQNGTPVDAIPEVISSSLIQRLRERQAGIEAQITQLATSLLPNHPRVKAARSQLAGYTKQINSAAKNIVLSLENDVDLRRNQEKTLMQDINRLKSEASRVGIKQVKLRELERKVSADRDALLRYQNQFIQAESRATSNYNPVDAVINQRGTAAYKAYFPKVIPFTAAGTFAVLLLSIIGLLAADLLSGRAFKPANPVNFGGINSDEYEMEVQMHNAVKADAVDSDNLDNDNVDSSHVATSHGMVDAPPIAPNQSDLLIDGPVAVEHTSEPVSQNEQGAFNLEIAEQAILALGQAEIAIVSPGGDVGSQMAWHLSRLLSSKGKSVAVVDLTGTGVTTTSMLSTKDVSGLGEVLTGHSQLLEVMFKDNKSDVHVLGAGRLTNAELANNIDRLGQVSKVLCDTYEFVIYDCGPIGANGLSKIADPQTLVVIPTLGSDLDTCSVLEKNLHASGYVEAIVVEFDETESKLDASIKIDAA
ncbi:MAG: exopolysaccharide transport family protein [Rhizobiales bacterium]|nr:exopolysaccharide transport family protein [Hyphomicrobiales bacterium]